MKVPELGGVRDGWGRRGEGQITSTGKMQLLLIDPEAILRYWNISLGFGLFFFSLSGVPEGSPSLGGNVAVYVWHKPTQLASSFLFCSFVCFCLYGPFNSISFHKVSWKLSVFSVCSSGLHCALLVLSTIYFFMKVSLSPDTIHCGWLGSKHQLIN